MKETKGSWAEGLTDEHRRAYLKLSSAKRTEAMERAAIIQEATGCPWPIADARALAETVTS